LNITESKYKNTGNAKSNGRVTAVKNTVSGKVIECRYGWNPLDWKSVERTMKLVLELDPFVDTVGNVFKYREKCSSK
jgi:hypothetical protein